MCRCTSGQWANLGFQGLFQPWRGTMEVGGDWQCSANEEKRHAASARYRASQGEFRLSRAQRRLRRRAATCRRGPGDSGAGRSDDNDDHRACGRFRGACCKSGESRVARRRGASRHKAAGTRAGRRPRDIVRLTGAALSIVPPQEKRRHPGCRRLSCRCCGARCGGYVSSWGTCFFTVEVLAAETGSEAGKVSSSPFSSSPSWVGRAWRDCSSFRDCTAGDCPL